MTQIEKGYNMITFENNKILLDKINAEISYPKDKNLKLPNNVEIHPNAKLKYRKTGWPFIELIRQLLCLNAWRSKFRKLYFQMRKL